MDGLGRVKSEEELNLLRTSFERTATEVRGVNQGHLSMVRQNLIM